MRVLNVNKYYYPRGGSEQYFFFVERALTRRGHEVVPFAMKHPENLPSPYAEYFVEHIDYFAGGAARRARAALKVIYSIEARRRLAQLVEATRPDVAHLHVFQQQLSHSILPELKRRRIPIVYTVHDLKPVCPNYKMLTHDGICERCLGGHFYHCVLHRCIKGSVAGSVVGSIETYLARRGGYYDLIDRFITPSGWYKTKLEQGGIVPSKVLALPLACDLDTLSPRYDDDGYFIYAGRLAEEKGVATLLQAMQYVPRGVRLKIVGTGPLESALKRHAAGLQLHNVEFVGFRTGPCLRQLLAGAMFFVVPSEWYENSPLVIYEAMCLGKPVIGARIGGIPELIIEGETGLTFESGNVAALAVAIDRLTRDRGSRRRLGQNARARAEQVYDPEAHVGRLLQIYRSCGAPM